MSIFSVRRAMIAILAVPSVCGATSCYTDGQAVTLTGSVHMKIVPPGPDSPPKGWHYALLKLQAAVCLKSDSGNTIRTTTIAIVGARGNSLSYKSGGPITVRGEIGSPQTGSDPPEDLLLIVSP